MASVLQVQGSIMNPSTYKAVLVERKLMMMSLVLTLIAPFIFVICICTCGWVIINFTHLDFKITLWLGVWGEWIEHQNQTYSATNWVAHFPVQQVRSQLVDLSLPSYYRTQIVFLCISLMFMVTGSVLGYYSMRHHRYVYKRLTAGLFIFAAGCVVVVIEVIASYARYWTYENVSSPITIRYGYPLVMSWIVFAIYLIAAFLFAFGSRKHKGSRAATTEFEEQDRPVLIGR